MSIPTLVVIRNGQIAATTVGARPKGAFWTRWACKSGGLRSPDRFGDREWNIGSHFLRSPEVRII
jgi:hypothetical protein